MSKLRSWKTIFFLCVFSAASAIASPAQTVTTLINFDGTDGANPATGSLVQGIDGNFYGTTSRGGASGFGTVFKITPGGTLTTLHSFDGADGQFPYAGLVQATSGNLYGTTLEGGAGGNGTVFQITPGGKLATLHAFDGADGGNPGAALVRATNGNFYGTTSGGGANGNGTVFEITLGGTLTTLHSFVRTDGANPGAALIQATNGNFYGTAEFGGAHGEGTVFEVTAGGALTTLYSFCAQPGCTDGANPDAGLVQATNGNFYGTTHSGGANGASGTVFRITPQGALTTLYSFCAQTNCVDGLNPSAGLVQAINGNFYGTTLAGGANGEGVVFEITPGGTLTTLHSFEGTGDEGPDAALVQATNGKFYGTTYEGGAHNDGMVFSLAVGQGPFVQTLPTSGGVGTTVIIMGNGLTGSTGVTFEGIAASFAVLSSSEIITTVPRGATTGKVKVTTPSGILTSEVNFRVTP
jgi:uncharacterized repeat protein (TIGR03803 family)